MDAVGATSAARAAPTQTRASIKLKLKFAEPETILSQSQLQDCLEQCWILLPSSRITVGDVAAFIIQSFDLSTTCPNGISLAMEGFTLPFAQSAALLQDSDLVHIRRLKALGYSECANGTLANLPRHVDETLYEEADPVRATVGYALDGPPMRRRGNLQSSTCREEFSESHDALKLDCRLPVQPGQVDEEGLQNGEKKATSLGTVPGKTKRSLTAGEKEDEPGRDPADQHPTLDKDTCIAPKVESRKKKQSRTKPPSEDHVDGRDSTEQNYDDKHSQGLPKTSVDKVVPRAKRKKPSPVKVEPAELEEAEVVVHSAKKPRKRRGVQSVTLHHETASSQAVKEGKEADGHKKKVAQEYKKVKLIEPQEEGNRPSRSARRKKAKRRWLREQAEAEKQTGLALNGVTDQSADGSKASSEDEEEGQQGQEKQFSYYVSPPLVQNENDRQHRRPVVDRPGHIRFEAWDDKDEAERHTLPDTKLGMAIMSKKQGQVWGQAKDADKYEKRWNHSRNYTRVPLVDRPLADVRSEVPSTGATASAATVIDFETLPALDSNPEEGDVLAYRLVELSSSWTPVLSVYRVGKVVSYDATSNYILLKPVQEYSLTDTFLDLPEQDEDSAPEPAEFAFPAPFNSDGSLGIQFTELVNVHLVQKAGKEKRANASQVVPMDIPDKESTEVGERAAAAQNGHQTENHTILKLRAQPAQHRSVRALRAAALGPALARLRAQQEL